ncbi:uncharacterized protein BX663DRAFT_518264 [Cokeromyces recurvatus]|uniref:uncharacterized protein n=1 Tax=Cokeromyces recurvatus TaxID=90255 RepID=UPI00221E3A00|nr:uncharacterized protein BX663DRAFT_518264 [Cokeromyces recurvatus]KAI7900321.1 hypothetical protein BX663DRAFT_518264 [Cokeromyces recurvatus]
MKWRALVLLLSGLAVIYIAVLSQDTPYLHPKIIYTSNYPSLFTFKPDKVVISTVGSYIYLTAFKFEALKSRGSLVGTGKLKLGVQGYVKQVKRPISNILSENDSLETEDWTPCFEHVFKGPISQISTRNIPIIEKKQQMQFAVLYHQVDNDNSYHYVRIYYTTEENSFEYKDIRLPGTTWVDAISLEKDSLIFSRDPDDYEFHIMTLPSTITNSPHHTLITALGSYQIEKGRLVQEWSQPYSTEQYSTLFSRLYSPMNETYRVFTLNVHKTTTTFYVNITIADNTTSINNENKLVTTWIQREKGESDYPVYNDDSMNYVGFSDISYQTSHHHQQQLQSSRISMPKLLSTVSADAKTIVFPYIKNKFITLDFTDRIDILKLIDSEKERLYTNDGRKTIIPEYYYWQGYETVDAEIMGIQLNEEGDNLALWTEYNYIYIYGRDNKRIKDKDHIEVHNEGLGVLGKLNTWVDYFLSDISDEEKQLRTRYFPPPWRLEMAIPSIRDDYGGSKPVGAVHFWQDSKGLKYLFVALKNGNINSYRIDKHEPLKSADFWTFASERWDMLFAMSMVITIFVYNEIQRP